MVISENDKLKSERASLFKYFIEINSPSHVLNFQKKLIEEIKRSEILRKSQNNNYDLKDHVHRLRLYGDALAHKFLSPHVIRQLFKNEGHRPPSLSSIGQHTETAIKICERLAEAGINSIISDLTHCLKVADIVSCAQKDYPDLIEIKGCNIIMVPSSAIFFKKIGKHLVREFDEEIKKLGRFGRQLSRMRDIQEYVLTDKVKAFGESDLRKAITVDYTPTYNWEVVRYAMQEAQKNRCAVQQINDYQVIIAHAADIGKEEIYLHFNKMNLENAKSWMVSHHFQPLINSWPIIAPPAVWPLPADQQFLLQERELILTHFYSPDAIIGKTSTDGIEILDIVFDGDQHFYKIKNKNGLINYCSSMYTNKIMFEYEKIESVLEGMFASILIVEKEIAIQ